MRFRIQHPAAGFTLLEVLVALFILIVGIAGVMQFFPPALNRARQATERTITAETANNVAGQMKQTGADSVLYGQIPESLKRLERAGGLYGYTTTVTRMNGASENYLQRVTVTITFADDRQESYVTYITKQ